MKIFRDEQVEIQMISCKKKFKVWLPKKKFKVWSWVRTRRHWGFFLVCFWLNYVPWELKAERGILTWPQFWHLQVWGHCICIWGLLWTDCYFQPPCRTPPPAATHVSFLKETSRRGDFRHMAFRPDLTLHRDKVAALNTGLCIHGQHEVPAARPRTCCLSAWIAHPGRWGRRQDISPSSCQTSGCLETVGELFSFPLCSRCLVLCRCSLGRIPHPGLAIVHLCSVVMRVQDAIVQARLQSAGKDRAWTGTHVF